MRYLLFVDLGIFTIGLFAAPEVFAQSNSTDTTPPEPSAPPVTYTAAEQECLSSANLSTTVKLYTVVSCQPTGFDITVYPGQRLTQTISWTPSEPGIYVAEIFLWNDLNDANPLSNVQLQYFTVT